MITQTQWINNANVNAIVFIFICYKHFFICFNIDILFGFTIRVVYMLSALWKSRKLKVARFANRASYKLRNLQIAQATIYVNCKSRKLEVARFANRAICKTCARNCNFIIRVSNIFRDYIFIQFAKHAINGFLNSKII